MLAAADLCLHILRQDHGQSYANDVSRLLVSPPFRTGGQAQYRAHANGPGTAGSLDALLAWALEATSTRRSPCACWPPRPT